MGPKQKVEEKSRQRIERWFMKLSFQEGERCVWDGVSWSDVIYGRVICTTLMNRLEKIAETGWCLQGHTKKNKKINKKKEEEENTA